MFNGHLYVSMKVELCSEYVLYLILGVCFILYPRDLHENTLKRATDLISIYISHGLEFVKLYLNLR
jgi:hypothetical protein